MQDENVSKITEIITKDNKEIVLDSFDYSQKFHFSLIDETKGVSLERINLNLGTNNKNNWHSASQSVRFATPGYKNSNDATVIPATEIVINTDKKIFSPDGDGYDDFVLLQYNVKKPGFLATIKIYDAEGFPILDLTNNYLLSLEGAIKWDGVDKEGKRSKLGMYIIVSKLFHPDGDIFESKNVVVVAGNL